MKKMLIILFIALSTTFAGEYIGKEADCLIIKEENSIICKFMSDRSIEDRYIDVEWINPNGEISRTRKILFPSGHGSVYDFRYLSGREDGTWTFNVKDQEEVYSTTFEVKATK